MTKLKMFARKFFRTRLCIVSLAGLAVALSACGGLMVDPQSQIVSYVYRENYAFVRIERIEPGAPDNAHPVAISPDALRQMWATLNVKGTVSPRSMPVFTSEELDEIVPHLVAALAKAGPKEDVTFAVTGDHGPFRVSPRTATTGRVFVQGTRLNLIFGRLHELYEGRDTTLYLFTRVFTPGLRARHLESGWNIEPVPENVNLADKRWDWLKFDATALAQKQKTDGTAATPAAPPKDARHQEIENKLRTLDRLKADGLITEEEYRERRKAILQGI